MVGSAAALVGAAVGADGVAGTAVLGTEVGCAGAAVGFVAGWAVGDGWAWAHATINVRPRVTRTTDRSLTLSFIDIAVTISS